MTQSKILDKGVGAVAARAKRLERLVVEYVPIDSIRPNDYNPNRQTEKDFEMLRRSMREDGFTQPIVCQRATRMIVDGEHRWRAARAEGLQTVPVVLVDMTDEQMRISTLRHNRARGSEDVELSAQVLRDLRELGALDWAQDALQLDDAALQRIMDDVSAPDALAGDDYNEGWLPTKVQGADFTRATDGSRDSMSDEAHRLTEEMRSRMQAAPTQDEKLKIERGLRKEMYRINLVFAGDDADLVRNVLSPKPAERLLVLCRELEGGAS